MSDGITDAYSHRNYALHRGLMTGSSRPSRNRFLTFHPDKGMEYLQEVFGEDTDYTRLWLFVAPLEEEPSLSDLLSKSYHWNEDGRALVTVVVVRPERDRMIRGEIWITRGDIPWLRRVVENTLNGVRKSQEGNRP